MFTVYEYTQVTVHLFNENLTLAHCLVAVCIQVLPYFLYLSESVVILEFGPTILCDLVRETSNANNKATV